MEHLLVIPAEDINNVMNIFGQHVGFNIQKVTKSTLGRNRIFIEKEGSFMCIEEYVPEANMPIFPYLEITTDDEGKYEEVVNGIALSHSTMKITNYDYNQGTHCVTIFSDSEGDAISIVVVLASLVTRHTLITVTDKMDEDEEG